MTLSKIKKANKKWKHEQARKKKRFEAKEQSRKDKIVNERTRKMYIQGRKEHLAKRRAEKEYIENLSAEVANGA